MVGHIQGGRFAVFTPRVRPVEAALFGEVRGRADAV
jgi:hypothetical protein